MKLEIISSEKVLFSGEADSVSLPGTQGAFTVLNNHASLASTLQKGTIEYTIGNERHSVELNGGFVDVDNNRVAVCIY